MELARLRESVGDSMHPVVRAILQGGNVPDGNIVTPVDDYTIWLECASMVDVYGSLANLVSNLSAMTSISSNPNAVNYMVRSSTIISAVLGSANAINGLDASIPVTIPIMTSNTAPSGIASAKSVSGADAAYKAFDNNRSTLWSSIAESQSWIQYEYAEPVWNYKAVIGQTNSVYVIKGIKIQYSDNGIDFIDALSATFVNNTNLQTFNLTANGRHKYWRLSCLNNYSPSGFNYVVDTLQMYGK